MSETIIISVGGSLICPEQINVGFLKEFKEIIIRHIRQGKRFILITGGGLLLGITRLLLESLVT